MRVLERTWGRMHWLADGGGGPTVVFSNALGTDLRVWDALPPHLPPAWRAVRHDERGHIPPVEAPDAMAARLVPFLREHLHG